MNPNNTALDQIAPQQALQGAGEPLSVVLNQLFYAGLAVAVVLALYSLVRAAVQYMSSDSGDSKSRAKARVQAAVGGLVLAFGSVLILNSINPSLTNLTLRYKKIDPVESSGLGLQETPVEVENLINSTVAKYEGISQETIEELLRTGKIPTDISPNAQKILAEALNAIDTLKSGAIPGTDGGNKACAAVVNMIIARATGMPINNSNSTIDMKKTLDSSSRFAFVGSDFSNVLPGDIILSPTGEKVGHVGFALTAGGTQIASNSSSAAAFKNNHTATSWTNYYGGKQGLPIYIYRPL